MFRSVGALRRAMQPSVGVSRTLSASQISPSLIKNFQEAMKGEAKKEGLSDEIRKLKKEVDQDLQKAAESEKFKKIKKETASGYESLKDKTDEKLKSLEDTQVGKKVGEAMKGATEAVEKLVDSALKFEFTAQQTEDDRMAVFTDDYVSPNYNKPAVVRMRKEIDRDFRQTHFDADEESQGMAVHKDYLLYEKFQQSALGKRFEAMGTKLNTSENFAVRSFSLLGQSVGSRIRKMTTNQYNETIKAVRRIDRTFDQENFVSFLEKEMIPIVLEAKALNNVEVVEDWCHDSPSQKFTLRHRQFEKEKIRYFEKTINLQKLEIIDALVHDNMPVFSVSFETHTLMAYQDKDGNLLTGKEYPQPTEVYKTYNQWSICRDPMEPEPASAWRVLECEDFSQKMAF